MVHKKRFVAITAVVLSALLLAGIAYHFFQPQQDGDIKSFNLSSGITLVSNTGLVVKVFPLEAEAAVELKVTKSEQSEPVELGLLDIYNIYDITILTQDELAEHPKVAITFPPDSNFDITEAIVLHEVDDQWIIAEGDITADENGITLVTNRLSRFALGYLRPVGKMPPITNTSDADVNSDGDLVVSVVLESATSSYFHLGGAPWYKVVVQNNPQLQKVSVPSDALFGRVVDNGCFLGPEGSQELILSFYGTGGKTNIRMNANGTDLIPIIGVDLLYTLALDKRMPWPIEPKHALGDFERKLVEFYEVLTAKIDHVPANSSFLAVRTAQTLKWMFDEAFSYAQNKGFELVFKGWVAFARISDIIINRLIYALMGFSEINFEVIASPGDFTLEITPTPGTVAEGESITFTAKAYDLERVVLSTNLITWSVTGGGTIDQTGKFTAAAGSAGQYTVTASTTGVNFAGETITRQASSDITVIAGGIPVTGVKLNNNTLNLAPNGTSQLTATVSPANATNKTISWTTSNPNVATVNSNGLVTAKAVGSATITVTTASGNITATCKVTVKEAAAPVMGSGNTGGNVANGGLAVSSSGWYYYAYDGIYRMKADGSSKTKLADQGSMLNLIDAWLYYYSPANWSTGTQGSIWRMKTDGSSKQRIAETNASTMSVYNGWIYYLKRNNNYDNQLWRISIEGKNQGTLTNHVVSSYTIYDDWIYFASEEKLYRIGLDGSGLTQIGQTSSMIWNMIVSEGRIFYRDIDGYIFSIQTNGSGKQQLTTFASGGFNIENGWVYYSGPLRAYHSEPYIYRMRLDGSYKETFITFESGIVEEMCFVDGWIYFRAWLQGSPDASVTYMYRVKTNGTALDQLGYNSDD